MASKTSRSNRSNSTDESKLTFTELSSALEDLRIKIKDDFSNELSKLRSEIKELKSENNNLREIVAKQQRGLLELERRSRENNLIFLGVPEADRNEDYTTVNNILTEVSGSPLGSTVKAENIYRLGKHTGNKCRPIKVVLPSPKLKRDILNKSSTALKQSRLYKKVFIKPDLCESERLERKRLYDKFKVLKNDPENHGKEVTLEKGYLKMDGNEIDHFDPVNHLFRP